MQHQYLPDWRTVPQLSGLGDLPHPPKQLYYQGVWNAEIFTNCVAIIGSRRMTEYGRRVIEKIIPQLVFEKKTVVSGFMYGVDQYAHAVCMENGGKTVAVLGWGIATARTEEDKKLADRIIQTGGLLLSEWEDQQPTLWTFPVRNRIVAALCRDVIVIEAAEKSGSLITATIAHKLKRNLWAVPGPITSKLSFGTNKLIAEGKARIWIEENVQQPLPIDDPFLRVLGDEALTANDIARKLHMSVETVGAQLSMLQLTGSLIERDGKYYVGKN